MSTAVERAQRISRSLLDTGICFREQGAVPWLVSPDRFPLTRLERAELEQLGVDCFTFLESVHDACVTADPVGAQIVKTLGGNELRAALTLRRSKAHPVPMIRPDVFWDADGRLTVVEIETMIGGYGMTQALRQAYGDNGFGGTARAYSALIRRHTRASRPCVAVVNPASKAAYDNEFVVFGNALATLEIDLVVVRPDQIQIVNDRATVNDRRIDVIHRFFRLSELAHETPASIAVLREITERSLVPVIQPWKELLEEKALFAFLHDPGLRRYWIDRPGSDTYARLVEALPTTVVVHRDSALVGLLLGSEATDRPFWLKKSGETWGGRGAIDGRETSSAKWRAALADAIADGENGRGHWILQERRVCRQAPVTYLDGDGITTKPMNLRVSPFFLRDDRDPVLSDVLVTARRSTKVHGARDAVMVPATCEA